MNLSELFIRRPVMTVLLNLAIIVAGLIAYNRIPVAALPSYNTPVINVSASLPGASPESMASAVALPLEKQFQTIPGLNLISSTSTLGSTSVTLEFAEDRDIDEAAVDVQAALLRAQRSLPIEMTAPPSYRKVNPADAPILFLALTSPSMNPSDLNDYAEHLIQPALSTLAGIAQVNVNGSKRFAVRIQVDPQALAARNISLDELSAALRSANANTPVGTLEGARQTLTLTANRQLSNAAEFGDLIVSNRGGSPVRLRDVANVVDSYESLKSHGDLNGQSAIFLSVQRQPDANTVQVVDAIKQRLPAFREQLPQSVNLVLVGDRSASIREALHDVTLTMYGTIALVVLVIFLFLRRFMATVIPTLSLPVSLIGAIAMLWAFGYTLDNISLLGLTLAVGLVVDDAIVMLENIMRHVEEGMAPFEAALKGSREVGFTIISISSSLIAVFIPIFFMPGVIGLLFHEFAVIVSLAIVASAFVSLTLVPMLAGRFLTDEAHKKQPGALVRAFGRAFDAMLGATPARSTWHCATGRSCWAWRWRPSLPPACCSLPFRRVSSRRKTSGRSGCPPKRPRTPRTKKWCELQARVAELVRNDPNVASVNSFVGGGGNAQNTGRMFINLKPRGERAPMTKVVEDMRRKVRQVPGGGGVPAAGAEPAPRRTAEQGAVSVHPAERRIRRAQCLGAQAAGEAARRPAVPRRHQRFAAEGLAGVAAHRPRPGQHARHLDRQPALHPVQRIR